MTEPRNLKEEVTPQNDAERLIEATLPEADDHRAGDSAAAEAILLSSPQAGGANIWVAAATGNAEAVREFVAADPELANTRGSTRWWEPLLYLCYSRLLRTASDRQAGFHEAARALLEAGADPNVHWIDPAWGEGNRETAIYGAAGVANDPELTSLLLEAGADPNDGETAYHSVEHDGVPCATALWPHFDAPNRGTALLHKLDYPDLDGLRTLLELGADPNGESPFGKYALHQAVFRGHPKPFFELLFAHGADPNREDRSGRTPYAMAARAGRVEILGWLAAAGASTDLAPNDALVAACASGDADSADELMRQHPDLFDGLSLEDQGQICEVADSGNAAGVALMLDLGWDIDQRGGTWGEGPIHRAAMQGHAETVQLLYERGADLTLRDRSYDASPLGWASHGGHRDLVIYLAQDPARLDARDLDALREGADEND